MKDTFIKDMVNNTMNIYKKAFEEGRKIGFQKGYLKGINEWKEIVDKTLSPKKEIIKVKEDKWLNSSALF